MSLSKLFEELDILSCMAVRWNLLSNTTEDGKIGGRYPFSIAK